MIHKNRPDAF